MSIFSVDEHREALVRCRIKFVAEKGSMVRLFKGMTKEEYVQLQEAVRRLAEEHEVPPIWFVAAWSI